MLFDLGIGFWGTYALEFSASTGYGLDPNNMAQRIYYIIWCYFHMGLSDWIKWLQPPVMYSQYSDDAWLYWFLHVCVTILIVEAIWKLIKKFLKRDSKKKNTIEK